MRELDRSFRVRRDEFLDYIRDIKRKSKWYIYTISNVTLISNPYITDFPKNFFLNRESSKNRFLLFIKSSLKFYIKQFILFSSYLISFFTYKIFYKKRKLDFKNSTLIDIFFLVDNINRDGEFRENYFRGLYPYLDNYIFLPRLYGANRNPFKLIEFFKIISKDSRNFLFEFELIRFRDFLEILKLITLYPFKTLRVYRDNNIFNSSLIEDIEKQQFEAFSRYILGKNIAKLDGVKKIFSWSEFQTIERSFNYGVRKENSNIKIYASQLYLNYEAYLNSYIDDIDFDMLSSSHFVLVNGKYYIKRREKVKYRVGVSFRYSELFTFKREKEISGILLLGSYIVDDTKYMLSSVANFKNVLFKSHPAVNIAHFKGIKDNIKIVDSNIYELFYKSNLVISTASGTAVEAVSCGLSVIIIASRDNLTSNPLVEYGRGKIWDIAFSKDEIESIYNSLISYRDKNRDKITKIAKWYKDNFFIEPKRENIIRAFDLGD